jgi:hypothetical protein
MIFGEFLRDLRKKNFLSRGALRLRIIRACGVSISKSCIRDLESGRYEWPREETENQILATIPTLKVKVYPPKRS